MGVGVQREPGTVVAQHPGDGLDIHSVLQGYRGERMPLWHNKDKSENPCGATGWRFVLILFPLKNGPKTGSAGEVKNQGCTWEELRKEVPPKTFVKRRLTMVNTPLSRALGVRNQIFHSNDTRSAVAWTWERMMSATCRRSSKSMLSQFPRWEDRYSIFCGETFSAFSAAISFISP